MSMTKEEVLAKYFSEKKGFRDVQEETIDSLLAGKNTLCLMPTGGGKSLIYQVAGLCMEKTTINSHISFDCAYESAKCRDASKGNIHS